MPRPPLSFHGFVGQRDIVKSLQSHCKGALSKQLPLPHTLFEGSSGTGKSLLARSVAAEMGTECHELYASRHTKSAEVAEKLGKVGRCDVVFIDEIHALPHDSQEIIYPTIDHFTTPEVDATTHKIIPNQWITIQPFTLIAATDQPGTLLNALRQRLPLIYTLSYYRPDEMRQIVIRCAAEKELQMSPQATTRMAEAARGIPRRAMQLVETFFTARDHLTEEVTKADIEGYLESRGIDSDNLWDKDRGYLKVLHQRKGHMSLKNLAIQLGLDNAAIERDVEHHLIREGLIGIASRGRFLTRAGMDMVSGMGVG